MATQSIKRPTYMAEQVEKTFDRIGLPQASRMPNVQTLDNTVKLQYLTTLQRCTLTSVPFESLELHYSPTHIINIDSEVLYHKIVTQGTGRGGYCMENNAFFGTLLRSLGFNVYSVAARVNTLNAANLPPDTPPEESEVYLGWGHMVNIVTLGDERYMVDVGFGPGGSTHPLKLVDRQATINMQAESKQEVRLRWDSIPENENQDFKLWIYERRIGEENGWRPGYCFPDGVEALPTDFAVMNHWCSTSRSVFFTYHVICSKFLLSEEGERIIGNVTIDGNDCHRRIEGRKEALATFQSETERVQGLEHWLGVRLSEAQKAGIAGMVSAL